VYELACSEGIELSTSTLHNAWQFYKNDNYFYDRLKVAHEVEHLITAMLRTSKLKNWFRAYLNLGLIEKILGHDRLIPCTAGRDFAFVDPWSDVWACNVRSDLQLGNLARQSWDEIMESERARAVLGTVAACRQNCWMVTTARTAMRSRLAPQLPKLSPMAWVAWNKLKVSLGGRVNFPAYIDYGRVESNPYVPRRSFLGQNVKAHVKVQRGLPTPAEHYPLANFFNR
jgi:hypothetical protein